MIPISEILPNRETLQAMARRRYQMPNVHKTTGKHPRWFVKIKVDVLVAPGRIERKEVRKYLGLCSEIGGKRSAERIRDELMKVVNAPDTTIPAQYPFSHIIATYRNTYIPTLKPNSQNAYECAISKHIEKRFGDMRVCDIKKDVVLAWLNGLSNTLSPKRRRLILSILKSIWEQGTDWGLIQERNPARGIRISDDDGGRRRDIRALTPDEARLILAEVEKLPADDYLRILIPIALYCGTRIGELLALRWRDVVPPRLYIRRSQSQASKKIVGPKSSSGYRSLPIPKVLTIKRPAGVSEDDRISTGVGYNTIQKRLERLAAKAGIGWYGFGWHTFRYTYATWMDNAGLSSLHESMGHASEWMSRQYVVRSEEDVARMQEAMIDAIIGQGCDTNSTVAPKPQ